MTFLKDICRGDVCGKLSIIVNKHFYLCTDCNYKRLHGGKTQEEVYREKQKGIKLVKIEKPKPEIEELKKTFSIKKISNKRAEQEKQLKIVYKEIDNERERCCEACGRPDRPLSHSHLLSRYNRPDLTCVKENIRLHCFGEWGGPNKTCHEKWSDMIPEEVVDMLDFKKNIEYIQIVDVKSYNRIVVRFEESMIKI
jgi:hypothetical protein